MTLVRREGGFQLGMATREAYGRTLRSLGRENSRIVALDADLSKSTMTKLFADEFPERFFDVGIAEANLVGTAAGLALGGKIPFISTFAVFCPGRCFDQLRMSVAYSRTNVKVAVSHAGLSVGEDGASHQAIEDMALARAMPGFVVLAPADEVSTEWAVRAAAEHEGPVYIRLGRAKFPKVYEADTQFAIGQANEVQTGSDVTIMACGLMLSVAIEAADLCREKGISARVLDMYSVEPLDVDAVVRAAQETGAVVTVEEHLLSGGMGSAVAQVLTENYPVPMEFVGIRNRYGESGTPKELLEKFGLTAENVCHAAERAVQRKRGG